MSIFLKPQSEEYSVVDPVQPELDDEIIVDNKIKPEVRQKIEKAIEFISKKTNLKINRVWIVGSSLTYQYTPECDIDVTVFIKVKSFEELKDLNKSLATHFNEKIFINEHPVNFHFVGDRYNKFKADAIYDIRADKWVKPPTALQEKDIVKIIKDCSSLKEFNEILSEYSALKKMLEDYRGDQTELKEILEKTIIVSNMFYNIKDIRREDFKKKQDKNLPSANFRCSNVVFKLLEQYGLGNLAEQVSNIIQSTLKDERRRARE